MKSERDQIVEANHRLGDYEIVEELRTDGTGKVFRARGVDRSRDFALQLKTITYSGISDEIVDQAQVEVRALARLEHPHIARLVEAFGVDGNRLAIATEFVDAEPMQDQLTELNPRHFLIVFRQLASALAELHRRGLLHRDLNPSNVLIGWNADGEPHAYLTGFGITNEVGSAEGEAGFIGAPFYACPEMVAGDVMTPASDIFGLGAIGYAAITGVAPFHGENVAQSLRRHLRWEKPTLTRFGGLRFPTAFCRVVEKMLEPDPGAREASLVRVMEVVDELLQPDDAAPLPCEVAHSEPEPVVELTNYGDDRVWVQSGVVYLQRPGLPGPRLIDSRAAYATCAIRVVAGVAYGTRMGELRIVFDDDTETSFELSSTPIELVAENDGRRLVVTTESGERYEASAEAWSPGRRIDALETLVASAHHAPAEGE